MAFIARSARSTQGLRDNGAAAALLVDGQARCRVQIQAASTVEVRSNLSSEMDLRSVCYYEQGNERHAKPQTSGDGGTQSRRICFTQMAGLPNVIRLSIIRIPS